MTFWFSSCGGVDSFLHNGGGCIGLTSVTPTTMEMSETTTSREEITIQSNGNVVVIPDDDDDDGENDSGDIPYSQDPHTTKSSTQTWLLSVASELSRKAVIVSPRGGTDELSAAANQKDYLPLQSAVEIVPDRIYYAALSHTPPKQATHHGKLLYFFQIDTELLYWNFYLDFGPLNLGHLYRFIRKLNGLYDQYPDRILVYYSSMDPCKRANATYLIAAWRLLVQNLSPDDAIKGLDCSTIPPFHDASPGPCLYELTILDCLRGIDKARKFGFFHWDQFDVTEYEHYEQVEHGDLNWIVHDRIVAFAGPQFHRVLTRDGYYTMTPADYVPYLKAHRIDLVIRLNKRCYNESDFIRAGIRHFDQYYLDGSCPTLPILQAILTAMETVPSKRAFAVHCKAGLGRTGTCIGAYLMKHYRMTAGEVIGWMRICRPGMVIGPQQQFLVDIQDRMWHERDVASSLRPTMENRVFLFTSSKSQPTKTATKIKNTTIHNSNEDDSEKGSPKSVTAILDFFTHNRIKETRSDIKCSEFNESQADGLLARRRK